MRRSRSCASIGFVGLTGEDRHGLADLVDSIVAEVGLSGVVRIDLGGRVAVQRTYGLAHRGLGIPTTVDTQFAIASGANGLTALTVMCLVETGELARADRVHRGRRLDG